MPRPVSQAQAKLFGAIASGKKTKATGMNPSEAKNRMRGVKMSQLPARAKKSRKGY